MLDFKNNHAVRNSLDKTDGPSFHHGSLKKIIIIGTFFFKRVECRTVLNALEKSNAMSFFVFIICFIRVGLILFLLDFVYCTAIIPIIDCFDCILLTLSKETFKVKKLQKNLGWAVSQKHCFQLASLLRLIDCQLKNYYLKLLNYYRHPYVATEPIMCYFCLFLFFYSPFVLRNYSTDSHQIFRNCVFLCSLNNPVVLTFF